MTPATLVSLAHVRQTSLGGAFASVSAAASIWARISQVAPRGVSPLLTVLLFIQNSNTFTFATTTDTWSSSCIFYAKDMQEGTFFHLRGLEARGQHKPESCTGQDPRSQPPTPTPGNVPAQSPYLLDWQPLLSFFSFLF